MSKNIRTIYLYVVSFISLFMIVGGIVSTVTAIASYKYPQVYYYSSYYDKETTTLYDEDNIPYNYNEGLLKEVAETKREHLREIYSSVAVAVVGVSLFAYHWSKVQKEYKKEGVS